MAHCLQCALEVGTRLLAARIVLGDVVLDKHSLPGLGGLAVRGVLAELRQGVGLGAEQQSILTDFFVF
ncbi:hypothetical protein SETIT_5G144400v2 [Setaria italica]|uniref:Uncharacterized protein n=1 Tax=Setaria italica TaxID=4555 RepID=A0A368R521_SETIT|nr:hypothetical protein SETIT_5G144400v2 [Setaria italica]